MNVRSCLMNFAKIVQEYGKLGYIYSAREIDDRFVDLVEITQLAVKHLCMTKVEYVKEKKIKARSKVLNLAHLEDEHFYIIGVYKNGIRVEFKSENSKSNNRQLYVLDNGEYEVRYASYPNFNNLDEEFDQQLAPYSRAIYLSACALWFLKEEHFTYYKAFHKRYLEEIDFVEGERSEGKNNH